MQNETDWKQLLSILPGVENISTLEACCWAIIDSVPLDELSDLFHQLIFKYLFATEEAILISKNVSNTTIPPSSATTPLALGDSQIATNTRQHASILLWLLCFHFRQELIPLFQQVTLDGDAFVSFVNGELFIPRLLDSTAVLLRGGMSVDKDTVYSDELIYKKRWYHTENERLRQLLSVCDTSQMGSLLRSAPDLPNSLSGILDAELCKEHNDVAKVGDEDNMDISVVRNDVGAWKEDMFQLSRRADGVQTSTDQELTSEPWIVRIFRVLTVSLLADGWEKREGAALGLTAILGGFSATEANIFQCVRVQNATSELSPALEAATSIVERETAAEMGSTHPITTSEPFSVAQSEAADDGDLHEDFSHINAFAMLKQTSTTDLSGLHLPKALLDDLLAIGMSVLVLDRFLDLGISSDNPSDRSGQSQNSQKFTSKSKLREAASYGVLAHLEECDDPTSQLFDDPQVNKSCNDIFPVKGAIIGLIITVKSLWLKENSNTQMCLPDGSNLQTLLWDSVKLLTGSTVNTRGETLWTVQYGGLLLLLHILSDSQLGDVSVEHSLGVLEMIQSVLSSSYVVKDLFSVTTACLYALRSHITSHVTLGDKYHAQQWQDSIFSAIESLIQKLISEVNYLQSETVRGAWEVIHAVVHLSEALDWENHHISALHFAESVWQGLVALYGHPLVHQPAVLSAGDLTLLKRTIKVLEHVGKSEGESEMVHGWSCLWLVQSLTMRTERISLPPVERTNCRDATYFGYAFTTATLTQRQAWWSYGETLWRTIQAWNLMSISNVEAFGQTASSTDSDGFTGYRFLTWLWNGGIDSNGIAISELFSRKIHETSSIARDTFHWTVSHHESLFPSSFFSISLNKGESRNSDYWHPDILGGIVSEIVKHDSTLLSQTLPAWITANTENMFCRLAELYSETASKPLSTAPRRPRFCFVGGNTTKSTTNVNSSEAPIGKTFREVELQLLVFLMVCGKHSVSSYHFAVNMMEPLNFESLHNYILTQLNSWSERLRTQAENPTFKLLPSSTQQIIIQLLQTYRWATHWLSLNNSTTTVNTSRTMIHDKEPSDTPFTSKGNWSGLLHDRVPCLQERWDTRTQLLWSFAANSWWPSISNSRPTESSLCNVYHSISLLQHRIDLSVSSSLCAEEAILRQKSAYKLTGSIIAVSLQQYICALYLPSDTQQSSSERSISPVNLAVLFSDILNVSLPILSNASNLTVLRILLSALLAWNVPCILEDFSGIMPLFAAFCMPTGSQRSAKVSGSVESSLDWMEYEHEQELVSIPLFASLLSDLIQWLPSSVNPFESLGSLLRELLYEMGDEIPKKPLAELLVAFLRSSNNASIVNKNDIIGDKLSTNENVNSNRGLLVGSHRMAECVVMDSFETWAGLCVRGVGDQAIEVRRPSTAAFRILVPLAPIATHRLTTLVNKNDSQSSAISTVSPIRSLLTKTSPVLICDSPGEAALCNLLAVCSPSSLRRYQWEGITWWTALRRCGLHGVLADDMGLGKTLQALTSIALTRFEEPVAAQAKLLATNLSLLMQVENSDCKLSIQSQQVELKAQIFQEIRQNIWKPCLVICPVAVCLHWKSEVDTHFPDRTLFSPRVLTTSTLRSALESHIDPLAASSLGNYDSNSQMSEEVDTRRPDLIIASYDCVRRHAAWFASIKWHVVVADEAHLLRNPATATSQAVFGLQANHRLALTGTPVQNRVEDLWSLFHWLLPDYLGTADQFRSAYVRPIQRSAEAIRWLSSTTGTNEVSSEGNSTAVSGQPPTTQQRIAMKVSAEGLSALRRLHRQVLPFVLRRLKSDVAADLPPKTVIDICCPLSERQTEMYSRLLRSSGWQENDLSVAISTQSTPSCIDVKNIPDTDVDGNDDVDAAVALYTSVASSTLLSTVNNLSGPKSWLQRQNVSSLNSLDDTPFTKRPRLASNTFISEEQNCQTLSPLQILRCLQLLCVHPVLVMNRDVDGQSVYRRHLEDCSLTSSGKALHLTRLLLETQIVTADDFVSNWSVNEAPSNRPITRSGMAAATNIGSPNIENRDQGDAPTASFEEFCSWVDSRIIGSSATSGTENMAVDMSDSDDDINESVDENTTSDNPITATSAALAMTGTVNPSASRRCLIFAQHRATLELIEKTLLRRYFPGVGVATLDGSLSPEARFQLAAQFNSGGSSSESNSNVHSLGSVASLPSHVHSSQSVSNDVPSNDIRILLLTARSAGLGLNLTAADTVIFVEHDWNPFVDLQAMDRTHRIGQRQPVTVYRLLADSTVEARLMSCQRFKQTLATELVDGTQDSKSQALGATLWNSLSDNSHSTL